MSFLSKLYVGSVVHRRLRPRRHQLRYRVFWMLIDLDEIETLSQQIPVLSHNRFNLVSFHDRDHGDRSDTNLREQITARLGEAGIDGTGRIELLCMPRILGYGFNPLSVYFCHDAQSSLSAIIYEVSNTFGERHSYVFPAPRVNDGVLEHDCSKTFYVSPFLSMDLDYHFLVRLPRDDVSIHIQARDRDGIVLTAALTGKQTALNNRTLWTGLLTNPLLCMKVIGAIHWHALRMLVKGFRVHQHAPAARYSITIVNAQSESG